MSADPPDRTDDVVFQSGRLESTIDLIALIAELLPMLRRLIGEQIEIVDRLPSSLPPVLGDRSQVEQIILNLAVNARDAMPAGGQLTIAARAERYARQRFAPQQDCREGTRVEHLIHNLEQVATALHHVGRDAELQSEH